MRFGFIPTEGGHFYREALDEVELGGGAGVRLGLDGGAPRHHEPLLALAAGGAGRVRRTTSRDPLGTDVVVTPFYHPVRRGRGRRDDRRALERPARRWAWPSATGRTSSRCIDAEFETRGARFAGAAHRACCARSGGGHRSTIRGGSTTLSGRAHRAEARPAPHPPSGSVAGGRLDDPARRRAWRTPGCPARRRSSRSCSTAAAPLPRRAAVRPGRTSRPCPAALTREVVIAATDAEARELAERHLMVNYRDEYGGGTWKHPLIGAEDDTRVDALDEIGRDRFIVGSPEPCIEHRSSASARRSGRPTSSAACSSRACPTTTS